MLKNVALLTALIFFSSTDIFAQVPTLQIKDINDNSVYLKELKIDISVIGNVSTTTMEMIFHNKNNRILEGNLTFPLPEKAGISGYALDMNGVVRNAVPVEKEKATQVFESIERRKIDPGLLEKVEGNNFRTRIYPIPANGNRTIRITYEEFLQPFNVNTLRYKLPLSYSQPIEKFKLNVQVLKSTLKPQIEEQPGDLSFAEWNENYTASMEKKDYTPNASLQFSIPKAENYAETVMQKNGDDYFFMINTNVQPSYRKRQLPGKIGIIWDASLSGLKRNLTEDFDLLDKYFKENSSVIVELALFNHTFEKKGVYKITDGKWEELRNVLQKIDYDGATNISCINLLSMNCEEYLLFTDGMSTFGESNLAKNKKPVFAICSSPSSDYGVLRNITNSNNGQLINLNMLNTENAVKLLLEEPFKLIKIKSDKNINGVFPSYPMVINDGYFYITGISTVPNQTLTLQFGYGNEITAEKKVQLNFSTQENKGQINVERIWAQQKIKELDLEYEKNKDAITALGKTYSIVTRNTSLIVLETVQDYVRYKIEPPAELRKEYYAILKQNQRNKMADEDELEAFDIYAAYRNLFEWWTGKKNKDKKIETSVQSDSVAFTAPAVAPTEPISPVTTETADMLMIRESKSISTDAEKTQPNSASQEVAVTDHLEGKVSGVTITNNKEKDEAPTIFLNEWTPSRPYLVSMEEQKPENYYTHYLTLRKDYFNTPTFYFDMANFFFRKKDNGTALKILSNIAELNIEDDELFTMLGYKLREAGFYNDALEAV